MSRRSKFEVIADILRFGEASRTKILYGSSIGSDLLDRYLSLLIERGFLSSATKGNHRIYHTTKEGEILLHQIDNIYQRLGKYPTARAKISAVLTRRHNNERKPRQ